MRGVLCTMASRVLLPALTFGYGIFTMALYALISMRHGYFFKGTSEKELLELQLARNRLWDLSRDFYGLTHHFLTLHNGFRFHYLCNEPVTSSAASGTNSTTATTPTPKPLLIFIHGFPDSWAVWRHIVSSKTLQDAATIVVVDLPGYGGSESLDEYTATNVLENLANFVVGVRAMYGVDSEESNGNVAAGSRRTVIVGHDWGCTLAMRLAAEAPQLADRFVLSNGPLIRANWQIGLVESNLRRLLSSSFKMFKTSLSSPMRSRSTLLKALMSLKPVLRQILLSGYVFVMRLPFIFVQYLFTGRNRAFLRMVHRRASNTSGFSDRDAADSMASTLGPSRQECKTKTAAGEEYPISVKVERSIYNFHHMASYYRQGAATARWQKSVETIANLHIISQGNEMRRASSGAGMFDEGPSGVLKASSTIIWGKNDAALEPQLCLDGISDYLVSRSQVVELPRSGHFTPIERESRGALEKAVEWAVKGEREDIGAVVSACYDRAVVTVRK